MRLPARRHSTVAGPTISKGARVTNPLAEDLDFVVTTTQQSWENLRGQRLFITGGTGFFGCWLLESFLWANEQLDLGSSAVVLTRNPEAFTAKVPHLAGNPAISLHTGDVRCFDYPTGDFARVIHAANDPNPNAQRTPLTVLDTIVEGTRHTLEFARQCGAQSFLFTSSGAVYGPQPPALSHVPEEYPGAPDPTVSTSVYGEGKRQAELLCALYARQYGLATKIARCFAFVGPYLPLNANFAIGNFIRDALHGGPIQIQGDGTPYRSYLYAADLAVWLWTILDRGKLCRAYNVGSEEAISIGELATVAASQFEWAPVIETAQAPVPGAPAPRYVPSTARAREELGLQAVTSLREGLRKTIDWHIRNQQARSAIS
jgi:nucleoside-diphosphate-sugar epimerase